MARVTSLALDAERLRQLVEVWPDVGTKAGSTLVIPCPAGGPILLHATAGQDVTVAYNTYDLVEVMEVRPPAELMIQRRGGSAFVVVYVTVTPAHLRSVIFSSATLPDGGVMNCQAILVKK